MILVKKLNVVDVFRIYVIYYEKQRKYPVLLILSLFIVSLFIGPGTSNAAKYNTFGVNSACGGQCSGYYTGHFTANFTGSPISGGQISAGSFKATMNMGNQFGDQWTTLSLVASSNGSVVLNDTSKSSAYTTAANSSYWQTFNKTTWLTSGRNQVDFNFIYLLKKKTGGPVEEIWYPIRRASNIN